MASSVDPDEMVHDEPCYLDLYYLYRYLHWSTGLKGLSHHIVHFAEAHVLFHK